jgi:hypothetical protein
MLPDDEIIVRILGEAKDALFPSEITDHLNQELGQTRYRVTEVVICRSSLKQQTSQLSDGRWTLKRQLS